MMMMTDENENGQHVVVEHHLPNHFDDLILSTIFHFCEPKLLFTSCPLVAQSWYTLLSSENISFWNMEYRNVFLARTDLPLIHSKYQTVVDAKRIFEDRYRIVYENLVEPFEKQSKLIRVMNGQWMEKHFYMKNFNLIRSTTSSILSENEKESIQENTALRLRLDMKHLLQELEEHRKKQKLSLSILNSLSIFLYKFHDGSMDAAMEVDSEDDLAEDEESENNPNNKDNDDNKRGEYYKFILSQLYYYLTSPHSFLVTRILDDTEEGGDDATVHSSFSKSQELIFVLFSTYNGSKHTFHIIQSSLEMEGHYLDRFALEVLYEADGSNEPKAMIKIIYDGEMSRMVHCQFDTKLFKNFVNDLIPLTITGDIDADIKFENVAHTILLSFLLKGILCPLLTPMAQQYVQTNLQSRLRDILGLYEREAESDYANSDSDNDDDDNDNGGDNDTPGPKITLAGSEKEDNEEDGKVVLNISSSSEQTIQSNSNNDNNEVKKSKKQKRREKRKRQRERRKRKRQQQQQQQGSNDQEEGLYVMIDQSDSEDEMESDDLDDNGNVDGFIAYDSDDENPTETTVQEISDDEEDDYFSFARRNKRRRISEESVTSVSTSTLVLDVESSSDEEEIFETPSEETVEDDNTSSKRRLKKRRLALIESDEDVSDNEDDSNNNNEAQKEENDETGTKLDKSVLFDPESDEDDKSEHIQDEKRELMESILFSDPGEEEEEAKDDEKSDDQ